MSFEKEFDRIIRQKAQQGNIPFDEKNWDKAQQMLDAQRSVVTAKKTAALTKLLFIAGSVVVVGVSALFVYNNYQSDAAIVANKPVAVNKTQENNTLVSENDDQDLKKSDLIEQTNDAQILTKPIVVQKQNKAKEEKIIPAAKPKLSVKNNVKKQIVQIRGEATTNSWKHRMVEEAIAELNNTAAINKEDGLTHKINDVDRNLTTTQSFDNTNQDQANSNNNEETNASVNTENSIPAKNQLNTSQIENAKNEELISQAENVSNNLFEYINPYPLPLIEMDTNLISSQIIILDRYDDKFSKGKSKSHFLNLGLGLNYLLGWSTPKGQDGKGLNYYANINYGFYMNKKLAIGVGFDLHNVKNMTQAFYINQKKEFSFGSSITCTAVTANELIYVGVPIKMYYDINYRNTITFGAMPAFLMQASSTLQTYNQIDGQKSNIISQSNHLVYNGMTQKTIILNVGFKTEITKRIWINAEALYGLTDLFLNNSGNQIKQIPIGLRAGIQFNIFD